MLRSLLFDLDGTLVDSAPGLRDALNLMLNEFARGTVNSAQVEPLIGFGVRSLVDSVIQLTGGPLSFSSTPPLERFHSHYSRTFCHSELYPGVATALRTLTARDISCVVCTNKDEATAVSLLRQLDVLHFFRAVVGDDSTPYAKPDPQLATAICEALRLTPQETGVVGDHPYDIAMAKDAGLLPIAALYGYGRFDERDLSGALKLKRFAELPALVLDYNSAEASRV